MDLKWTSVYTGDNESKRLDIYVDKAYREWDVYVYLLPVSGENAYVSAQTIPLDENDHGEYYVPGDVTNAKGYFRAQIICLGPNGEIAKGKVYSIPCGESIDDTSAVLPTGEVVTLAQFAERLKNLSAADVAYTDTEEIGAANVQEAIDYALTHGGGAETPVYTLLWADNPELYAVINAAEVAKFADRDIGTYELYLDLGNSKVASYEIKRGKPLRAYFRGSWNGESERIFVITSGITVESYSQQSYVVPSSDFDPLSLAAPSMLGVSEYVDERIGTTGNLDPSTFATKTELEDKYEKPLSGIPKTDLAPAVRTSLNKADTAVQPSTPKNAAHILRLTANTATLTDGCTLTADDDYWTFIDTLNYMTSVSILAEGSASDSLSLQMHVAAAEHPDEVLPLFTIYNGRLFYVELTDNANGQLSGTLSVTEIADKAYVTSTINSAIGDAIGGSY